MTGLEFAEECAAAGVSVSFENIPQSERLAWWTLQERQYGTVEAFLSGYGILQGGTAQTQYGTDRINESVYTDDNDYTVTTTAGNVDINVSITDEGWTFTDRKWYTEKGITYIHQQAEHNGGLYINVTWDGQENGRYSFPSYFRYIVVGPVDEPFEYEVSWRLREAINRNTVLLEVKRRESHVHRYVQGVLVENPSVDERISYVEIFVPGDPVRQKTTVTITYEPQGGGGGGDIEEFATLTFEAQAGLSGRHCDPLIGSYDPNYPEPRMEQPAYGCGGYGGHGGGGGGGAATAVIYQFASDKADFVETKALTQRHGYGSGGGAGGPGGDGCILIFW